MKPLGAALVLMLVTQLAGTGTGATEIGLRLIDVVGLGVSGTVLLALVAAAVKYGRLLEKVDDLQNEVERLRNKF
jgi:hypothetical protein